MSIHSYRRIEPDPDETIDINTLLAEVVPDHEQWSKTPNPVLGGKKPEQFIGTDEEGILRDLLRAVKHGMAS